MFVLPEVLGESGVVPTRPSPSRKTFLLVCTRARVGRCGRARLLGGTLVRAETASRQSLAESEFCRGKREEASGDEAEENGERGF